MTPRERFLKVLNFERPDDWYPIVEWAPWWDETLLRWKEEGLPGDLDDDGIFRYFGLDPMVCLSCTGVSNCAPAPPHFGAALIHDEKSYGEFKKHLFTDKNIRKAKEAATSLKKRHENGEIIVRLWLDGFFWFPRVLFGIEGHLFAFYDYPELMHKMNNELADYNIRIIEEVFDVLKPDMVGFAEDMSYNNGPMLSYDCFKEFIEPYYRRVIPHIKKYHTKVLVDSDGDITEMIPWMIEAGVEGVYPLERQAKVDINQIRSEYPRFIMLGGFDKMVMPLGEEAMRKEFERILPVMQSGGYIASVDHQTPPGVSLANYKIYIKLFDEYCSMRWAIETNKDALSANE